MTDKLRDALHQYEQIGPAKMDRSDLNIIRDAAALAHGPFWSSLTAPTKREAIAQTIREADVNDLDSLEMADRVIAKHIEPLEAQLASMTDEIELKRIDASLEDVLGDLEKYETRSDAVAEVCRLAARASAFEAERDETQVEAVARALFDNGPPHRRPGMDWHSLSEDWKDAFRKTASVALTAAESRASTLEGEREHWIADYDEQRELVLLWQDRASTFKALLAECATALTYAADNIDGILREDDIASSVIRDTCRSVLVKLKARTGDVK